MKLEKIKLWENGTPLYDASYGQPETTITPYIVDNGDPTGAVIVFPGGGYCMRADHEGEPIALMLNEAGISAFVLDYRVAPYKYPAALLDARRAVRYVRKNAAKFNIKPDKIGVLGFSAGGHLAVTAIEQFDYGMDAAEAADDIDLVSSRPDAGILCYPVASLREYTHTGSRDTLLGVPADPALVDKLSAEISVREDMPPVFMWHTAEDNGVPVQNCLHLACAMSAKKLPYELHVFPYGPHGLGLAPQFPNVAQWAPLLCNWLHMYKF